MAKTSQTILCLYAYGKPPTCASPAAFDSFRHLSVTVYPWSATFIASTPYILAWNKRGNERGLLQRSRLLVISEFPKKLCARARSLDLGIEKVMLSYLQWDRYDTLRLQASLRECYLCLIRDNAPL